MARRPGRKRNKPVTKVPLSISDAVLEARDKTAYYEGVVIRDRVVGGRTVTLKERITELELICSSVESEGLRKRLALAGETFSNLWGLCRLYVTDAPSINPPTIGTSRSFGGHDDLSNHDLSKGEQIHARYQGAVAAMCPQKDALGRQVVSAVVSVCIRNERVDRPQLAVVGLNAMADFFGL